MLNPFSKFDTDYLFFKELEENDLISPLKQFTIDNTISEINFNAEAVYDEEQRQS